MINITGSGEATYWDNYSDRVQGAPYFLGFNTEFSDVPEFMPIDTLLYTIWVPELTDTGRIYTALETINMPDGNGMVSAIQQLILKKLERNLVPSSLLQKSK